MNGYSEDLDSLLDSLEYDEAFDEAAPRRTSVRKPSRQSSFVPRQTTTPASQTQVQSTARSLDSKIETLSSAVQALETRTNTLSTAQDRQGGLLRREVADRRKSTDSTRSDIQQTKMLAVLLPLLSQQDAVDATQADGTSVRVLTQPQNQLSTLLPLMLLMPGYSGGDGKGGLGGGDSTMMMLLLFTMLGRK